MYVGATNWLYIPRRWAVLAARYNGDDGGLQHAHTYARTHAQVKPKVEAMLLEEIHLNEALEETLGKEQLEKELDAALEAQGGENADLSKAFPVPEEELKESEIQDAEMA